MRKNRLLLAALIAAAPLPVFAKEPPKHEAAMEMDLAGPVPIVTDLKRSSMSMGSV